MILLAGRSYGNKDTPGADRVHVFFYYLGDRTVIKTAATQLLLMTVFYYLGDRTVIKTMINSSSPFLLFYYLGDC